MRFIHLCPQIYTSRIARIGIGMGNGRRGKGVYAVPMMLLEYISFTDSNDGITTSSLPTTSSKLWKWLIKQRTNRTKTTAFVFELPETSWPIDLYLEVHPSNGLEFLRLLEAMTSNSSFIQRNNLDFVTQSIRNGFIADLEIEVRNSSILGTILKYHKQYRSGHWSKFDDSLEVVIRNSVPAKYIQRIVPLYKTNLKIKRQRLSSPRYTSKTEDN